MNEELRQRRLHLSRLNHGRRLLPKYLENLSGALGRTPGLAERFPFSDARRYLHGDLIGSLSEVTKEDGNIEFPRAYDAFGVITGSPNSFPRPHGYAFSWTYQEDRDSRLNLVGHRYYDPGLGRFITRDPAKHRRNWYTYCENNPLTHVDKTSLAKIYICHKSVAGTSGYHAFLVVVDERTGKKYYFRGGIDHKVGLNEISFRWGPWDPSAVDWMSPNDGNRKNTRLLADDDREASYYVDIFARTGQAIEDSDALYILGPFNSCRNAGNSNSLCRELIESGGLTPPSRHPVWVPWWQSELTYGGKRNRIDRE